MNSPRFFVILILSLWFRNFGVGQNRHISIDEGTEHYLGRASEIIAQGSISLEALEEVLFNIAAAINLGDLQKAPQLLLDLLIGLPEHEDFLVNNGTWVVESLHNPENRALLSNNIAISPALKPYEKEHFWRLALSQERYNVDIAKNFAYYLEQHNQYENALQVLRNASRSSNDWSLLLMEATLCPPHFSSVEEAGARYVAVLTRMRALLRQGPPRGSPGWAAPEDPGRAATGALPLGWAYLGQCVRPLHEGLAALYRLAWPWLADPAPHLARGSSAVAPPGACGGGGGGRLRLGVVAEQRNNPSPRKLLQPALARLPRARFELVLFVPPSGLAEEEAPFDREVLARADRVVRFGGGGGGEERGGGGSASAAARRAAAAAEGAEGGRPLHALVWEALGTNDAAPWLLAHGRLAPVQVAYGHGHPVTSGLDSVDYFLSSTLLETDAFARTRDREHGQNQNVAAHFASLDGPPHLVGFQAKKLAINTSYHGDGVQDHTEQVVLLETLTTYFLTPAAPAVDPQIEQQWLQKWATHGLVFPSGAEGKAWTGVKEPGTAEGAVAITWPVLACLQHSKKLHPAWDPYLQAALEAIGPQGRIVMLEGARKAAGLRWERKMGSELVARIVFLPFMPHEEALSIVQRSTAVLDTFPWGMGVTAFEAFSVCTPVLTVPSMTAVLQLTLGQYRKMGLENEPGLIISSPKEMAAAVDALHRHPTDQKETTDTDGQRRDDDGSSSTESVRRSSGGTSMALREMICRSKRRLFEDWEAVEELGRFLERAVCAALL